MLGCLRFPSVQWSTGQKTHELQTGEHWDSLNVKLSAVSAHPAPTQWHPWHLVSTGSNGSLWVMHGRTRPQVQGDTCPGEQSDMSDIIQGDRKHESIILQSAVSRWHRVTLYTAACIMCCSQQDCHSFNWIHSKTSSWVDGYNLHNIIFYVRYLPSLRFLVKNFSENVKMPKFHGASAWPEMDPGHSGAAP